MTSDISLLSSHIPVQSLPPIHSADGNSMSISHIGTVNTPTIKLSNTYHVPNLTFNLASVGQLCDLGLTIIFSSHGCQVQDSQTGQVIGTGRKVGRLFELTSLQHSPVFPAISAPVTDNTLFQWHLRLGHASSNKLRSLTSTGLLNNVSQFNTFDCLHCKMAKQPALSFPKSASLCDKPFGLIHSDIWGPAPCPTVNGYRYFVLFIDDYSRFTWIYFLRNRSSLYQIYVDFANMIQTQFSSKIKILRTDNAMEYKDSRFLSFLAQQGTLIQRSCPHTSQQNGRAERKHRHILDSFVPNSFRIRLKNFGRGASPLFMSSIAFHLRSYTIFPHLNDYTVLLQLTLISKSLGVHALCYYIPMNIPNGTSCSSLFLGLWHRT
ncbi:hypothetical protein IC575_022842 [Cucumis melo]